MTSPVKPITIVKGKTYPVVFEYGIVDVLAEEIVKWGLDDNVIFLSEDRRLGGLLKTKESK